jgi:hypothetical protein
MCAIIESNDFKCTNNDPCVFVKIYGTVVIVVAISVDDIIIESEEGRLVEDVIARSEGESCDNASVPWHDDGLHNSRKGDHQDVRIVNPKRYGSLQNKLCRTNTCEQDQRCSKQASAEQRRVKQLHLKLRGKGSLHSKGSVSHVERSGTASLIARGSLTNQCGEVLDDAQKHSQDQTHHRLWKNNKGEGISVTLLETCFNSVRHTCAQHHLETPELHATKWCSTTNQTYTK